MKDNSLTTNVSVVFDELEDTKHSRFLDESTSHSPISYNNGKATLPGGIKNHELASNVNLFVMYSEKPVTLKIGDTTSPELKNLKMFVYDGETTNIFANNTGTDPVKLTLVTAKF